MTAMTDTLMRQYDPDQYDKLSQNVQSFPIPWDVDTMPGGALAGAADLERWYAQQAAQASAAPELWWQIERRQNAVKQAALVALRADVRHMLMGG